MLFGRVLKGRVIRWQVVKRPLSIGQVVKRPHDKKALQIKSEVQSLRLGYWGLTQLLDITKLEFS